MKTSVGFVGGGQMAVALAGGAVESGVLVASQLTFAEPDEGRQQLLHEKFPEAAVVDDGSTALQNCGQIILAVKPHVLKQIASTLKPHVTPQHLLVSIAAGVSLPQLQGMFGSPRIVRVMPNTPCQVGYGASAIAADESLDPADVAWVERLMGAVGWTVRVPDQQLHAVTGVAGSSPAYVYLIIEALSDGGVAMGLPRTAATRLAAQAVLGAAQMVLQSGLHPGQLKDQVTSPGGTTIEALRELEAAGVRSAFIEAVCRCAEKSEDLA
jgi:pyrroline-5-carboxylate reductase